MREVCVFACFTLAKNKNQTDHRTTPSMMWLLCDCGALRISSTAVFVPICIMDTHTHTHIHTTRAAPWRRSVLQPKPAQGRCFIRSQCGLMYASRAKCRPSFIDVCVSVCVCVGTSEVQWVYAAPSPSPSPLSRSLAPVAAAVFKKWQKDEERRRYDEMWKASEESVIDAVYVLYYPIVASPPSPCCIFPVWLCNAGAAPYFFSPSSSSTLPNPEHDLPSCFSSNPVNSFPRATLTHTQHILLACIVSSALILDKAA